MLSRISLIAIFTLSFISYSSAQKPRKIHLNPKVIEGNFVKKTGPLRDFVEPPFDGIIVKENKEGYTPKDDWILNERLNPNAKPDGLDPAWQQLYSKPNNEKALIISYDGIGHTNVQPPDPAVDVSSNHVIQMINGSGGSYFKIWDKAGAQVQGQTYFDSFTGIGGAGDPIVLYDQMADRWLMSEFSNSGNLMVVAITETNDPLGSWYVYSYQANSFPDYPKFGIWPDAYVVTTNESDPNVYVLDRAQMLAGNAGTAQDFQVPSYGTIGFQSMTPVDFDGTTLPPANEPGMVMRMADDAWDANLTQDQLEIWEYDIDFATPSNSTLTLVQEIATDPFDTELCGYTSFSCIPQQGSGVQLDPLRELLMNRIHYRRFSSYEAMVMCHATDVDGNDRAGVRWYELRRTTPTANWTIYQQGTYSPDTESRWMASIAINGDGSIGLAYNTSSNSSYPSLKYTGRKECDALGSMTEPETVIVAGGGANTSNRYGDYASMSVDPSDGSFWFTGEYNPTSSWSTRVCNFDIATCSPTISFTSSFENVFESNANINNGCLDYIEVPVTISLAQVATADPTVTLVISGSATAGEDYEAPSNLSATLTSANPSATFVFKVFDDAYVEVLENIIVDYTLAANGGDATAGSNNQTVTIEINSDDLDPSNSAGNTFTLVLEDFETNTLASYSTSNPSGDTPFQTGTESDASSTSFTVPAPPSGTYFAWINDDDCNCDQNAVTMNSSVIDLSTYVSATLKFDYFYEDNSYQGDQEDFDVEISTDGGTTFSLLEDISSSTNWSSKSIDLTSYVGQSNVVISFLYSDGTGWLYGLAIDNIEIEVTSTTGVQTAVNSSDSAEEYLGPNATVHYYDPNSGNIMLTIVNSSSHDYGCTEVEVDRAGTAAAQFSTTDSDEYVSDKTFKISPEFPSTSGTYTLELYYTETEIAGWESATGNNRNILEIVKVAGNNQISDVTPSNASNFTISYNPAALSNFNGEVIVSSTISSGFSGFGLGIPDDGSSTNCGNGIYYTNTWIGPSTGDWHANPTYWSLGIEPDYCHHVIIPAGKNVTVSAGNLAKGYTLQVDLSGTLTTVPTALLDIVTN